MQVLSTLFCHNIFVKYLECSIFNLDPLFVTKVLKNDADKFSSTINLQRVKYTLTDFYSWKPKFESLEKLILAPQHKYPEFLSKFIKQQGYLVLTQNRSRVGWALLVDVYFLELSCYWGYTFWLYNSYIFTFNTGFAEFLYAFEVILCYFVNGNRHVFSICI